MNLGRSYNPVNTIPPKSFTEFLWEDDQIKDTWRDVKNIKAAAGHTYKVTSREKYCKITQDMIIEEHKKKFSIDNNLHYLCWKTALFPHVIAKELRGALHALLQVFVLNSREIELDTISQFEKEIMINSPIRQIRYHNDRPKDLYSKFLSYVTSKLGKQSLINNLQTFWMFQSIKENKEIEALVANKWNLDQEIKYGELYGTYMNFIDLVERLVIAGQRNLNKIKSIHPEHHVKPDQRVFEKVTGFDLMHEIFFHKGYAGRRGTLPKIVFDNPLDGITDEERKSLKAAIRSHEYLARGKHVQIISQFQKIQIDNEDDLKSDIPSFVTSLKSCQNYIKGYNKASKMYQSLINKILRIIKVAFDGIENSTEFPFLIEFTDTIFKDLKGIASIDHQGALDYVINTFSFYYFLKDISQILSKSIMGSRYYPAIFKENFQLQCMKFYKQCLSSCAIQTNGRRRTMDYLDRSMLSEFGKSYRVYLCLREHFEILGGKNVEQTNPEILQKSMNYIYQLDKKQLIYNHILKDSYKVELEPYRYEAVGPSKIIQFGKVWGSNSETVVPLEIKNNPLQQKMKEKWREIHPVPSFTCNVVKGHTSEIQMDVREPPMKKTKLFGVDISVPDT
ncbi:hypothetical protein DFH28DRAFT_1117730 [Melampsora americana]|nr:hypothetical protein DFH28DRAFT_1117730 [Melampsora americana]